MNAYFGDFVITWLIVCNELQKSLKALENGNAKICETLDVAAKLIEDHPTNETTFAVPVGENLTNGDFKYDQMNSAKLTLPDISNFSLFNRTSLELISNSDIKLQKIAELCDRFLEDILDKDTVNYFKNISKLKRYESDGNSGQAEKKGSNSKVDYDEILRKNLETHSAATISNGTAGDELSNPNEKPKESLSDLLYGESSEPKTEIDRRISYEDAKILRDEVEKFEKERVSAPNPFMFICQLREFLAKQETKNSELTKKLETMLIGIVNELKIK